MLHSSQPLKQCHSKGKHLAATDDTHLLQRTEIIDVGRLGKGNNLRTLALRRFHSGETEINRHYWSYVVIGSYAKHIGREYSGVTPTATVFHASGRNSKRIPPSIDAWLQSQVALENWLRLSAATSCYGLFETYLRDVVTTSVMCNPGLLIEPKSSVNGTYYLKNNFRLDTGPFVSQFTSGGWPVREKAFARVFNIEFKEIRFFVKTMEHFRVLRNDYAHAFGQDLHPVDVYARHLEVELSPSRTLSERRLLRFMDMLSRAARHIDRALLGKYQLFRFDITIFYHGWRELPKIRQHDLLTEESAFHQAVKKHLKLTISTQKCKSIIEEYHRTS